MKTVKMAMLYFGYEFLESLYLEYKDNFIMPKSQSHVFNGTSASN